MLRGNKARQGVMLALFPAMLAIMTACDPQGGSNQDPSSPPASHRSGDVPPIPNTPPAPQGGR
jgi:hypothetical protein